MSLLGMEEFDYTNYSNSFVPYLYLDGHRTGFVGKNEIESYKSGFKFFLRFTNVMKSLGFNKLVTMVHTTRNMILKDRMKAIQKAIQESVIQYDNQIKEDNFHLFGDLIEYEKNGIGDFGKYLENTFTCSSSRSKFNHYFLINYSENWALKNLNKIIDKMPDVSCVIRFTKGHTSGGWIPLKMQESTFIYCQNPSVSKNWTDGGILALLLISLKNWITMREFIGKKKYDENEKNIIHKKRDIDLNYTSIKLDLNLPHRNRIIAFEINGPIEYEI